MSVLLFAHHGADYDKLQHVKQYDDRYVTFAMVIMKNVTRDNWIDL